MAVTNTNQAKRLDPDPQNKFALISPGRHPPEGLTLSRPYWRELACNSANAEAVYPALGMQAHLIRARLFTVKLGLRGCRCSLTVRSVLWRELLQRLNTDLLPIFIYIMHASRGDFRSFQNISVDHD